MSRTWDKAKTGAKTGAIGGAIVGGAIGLMTLNPFVAVGLAALGAVKWGIIGGMLGGIFGAVTKDDSKEALAPSMTSSRGLTMEQDMSPDLGNTRFQDMVRQTSQTQIAR